jgi:hypothetical protein
VINLAVTVKMQPRSGAVVNMFSVMFCQSVATFLKHCTLPPSYVWDGKLERRKKGEERTNKKERSGKKNMG